jgi:zinc transporter
VPTSRHFRDRRASRDRSPPIRQTTPVLDEILPGLICGYRFGRGRVNAIAAALEIEPAGGEWVWLHVNLADMRCRPWLADRLPSGGLEHLLGKGDSPSLAIATDQIAGIFFDLTHELAVSDEDFGPLRFAGGSRILVTGRRTPLRSVETLRGQMHHGRFFSSPAELVVAMAEQIASSLDALVDRLSDEVDHVEDMLLKDYLSDDRQSLGIARLTSVRIHRRVNGMRTLFRRLDTDDRDPVAAVISAGAARILPRFDDVDHAVVELRDRARLLQDELGVRLAEQTNRQLRLLSVLTALFLPPTLITGVFGMNVSGLPFSGGTGGFLWVIGLIAAVSGVTLWALAKAGVLK